jgi:hypothetical protein
LHLARSSAPVAAGGFGSYHLQSAVEDNRQIPLLNIQ